MHKLFSLCLKSIFFLIGLSILAYAAVRTYVITQAEKTADEIIAQASDGKTFASADEEIIAITNLVFQKFEERDPSDMWYMRLRPVITNKRLPEFIKFPVGSVATISQQGKCDGAARMLKFILARKGYQSVQWNMITNSSGHSALLVDLPDGRQGFVDPFFGFTAQKQNKLISLKEVQDLANAGTSMDSVLLPFSDKSRPDFYKDIKTMMMGAEGDEFFINANLPILSESSIFKIGQIDGYSKDVKNAAGGYGMTPFWNYMGHKYNREWVRELTASQDVKLEFILTKDIDRGVLTAEPEPQIEGRTLSWDLKAGEKITFHDGRAKISLLRMNSYIPVDQIIISKN